jgi:hypothetical protein
MRRCAAFTVFITLVFSQSLDAQVAEYAVQVSAEVKENPPQIIFSWPADPVADQYYIYKKSKSDTCWGDPTATLEGSAIEFVDTGIHIGEAYEYAFYKNLCSFTDTVDITNGTTVIFAIHDSWGDGICCDRGIGSYRVFGNIGEYASGGDFDRHDAATFVVDGGDTTTYDRVIVSIILDIFGEETTWELLESPSGNILASGGPYESPKFGHIFAGILYPMIEDRGTALLLVDDTFSSSLSYELDRWESDLICDGWRVKRHHVDRNDDVTSIKELIVNECTDDPTITTVILLGHVPVPYSGNVMAGHSDHLGAYPADVYYAELDGQWTDDSVSNTTASRTQNHNVPGDGKFDQTLIPSDVDLCIGRVDLYDLPAFQENETELLRRYLDKNHAFRRGQSSFQQRGLIDDNVGVLWGLAITGIGLRNFSAMFGASQVHHSDYFSTMQSQSYLCSQGCGGGSYTSCNGVGTTSDFAARTVRSVFTMLYGSYFGDWDSVNNLLRASLASQNSILTCCWAGAPAWHFHHMALGETIGYSTRLTQNNASLYTPTDRARQIHVALMGDPTLRMHVVRPPTHLQVDAAEHTARLVWNQSGDRVEGYHVYRSGIVAGNFLRLTAGLIADTHFVDPTPLEGKNIYMVRAVKLDTTGSGTYFNPSLGILDSVFIPATDVEGAEDRRVFGYALLQNYPNPFNSSTTVRFQLPEKTAVALAVYNIAGQRVRVLVDEPMEAGRHSIVWDGRDDRGVLAASGIYFSRLIRAGGCADTKAMVLLR